MTELKEIVYQEFRNEIRDRCEGCQHNHPSQLKHFYCFFDWEQDKELLAKIVYEKLNQRGKFDAEYTLDEFFKEYASL